MKKNTADWHRVYRVMFNVQYNIKTQPIAAHMLPAATNTTSTQIA